MTKAFDAPEWGPPNLDADAITAIGLDSPLGETLAASYCLALKTHAVSWNADGPLSMQFRTLARQQFLLMTRLCDSLAERLRGIGGKVPEHPETVLALGAVEIPEGGVLDRLNGLARDHERLVYRYRALAIMADRLSDPVTRELATAGSARHENEAWRLRSLATTD